MFPVIRTLRLDDIPVISEIEKQAFEFPWSRKVIEECYRANYVSWVLEVEGNIIGYAWLQCKVTEAELLNIAVIPRYQGHGYGKMLLEHVLADLYQKNITMLFLEVRVGNLAAIKLYEKFGFHQIGVRPNYYPSAKGREDALVYIKHFL